MKKNTFQFLKQVDLFKKPVQLLIKREEFHRTYIGAILSVTILTIMMVLLYSDLSELQSYSNPISLTTEVHHSQPDAYLLKANNFTITFALQNSTYHTYIDDTIYVVTARLVTKQIIIEDGMRLEKWSMKNIPIIQCTENLIRQKELFEYFINRDLTTNYCIDWNKIDTISLEGTFDSSIYQAIELEFSYCNKQIKPNAQCKNITDIKKSLQSNFYSMQLSSNIINLKNPKQPHQNVGQDLYTTVSSSLAKELSIYMQPLTTTTDFGFIDKQESTTKSLKYIRHSELFDINESENFLRVVLRLDIVESINFRSYPKIQSILGQIGGLWNVLFTLALILQKPISLLSYRLSIINSLFNFDEEDLTMNERKELQLASVRGLTRSLNLKETRARNVSRQLHQVIVTKQQYEQMDKTQRKQISLSIKQYFKIVSQALKLKWTEYLYCLKCNIQLCRSRKKFIDFATLKMEKQCDILYIIKKLQEIDKLKMILLTPPQIQVFNYLPKPIILKDHPEKSMSNQSFSILRPTKNTFQRAMEAQKAFQKISADPDNIINERLIGCMDEITLDLLKLDFHFEDLMNVDAQSIAIPQDINGSAQKPYSFFSKNASEVQAI